MRKKIAFLVSSFDVGGAERQYDYLINTLSRDLFDVHIIQISSEKRKPGNGKTYQDAVMVTFDRKHRLDMGVLFKIARYIRQNRIELLQSQLFLDNQVARVVGFLSGRPVITSVRGGPTLGKLRTKIEHGFQFLAKRVVVNSHWLKALLIKDGAEADKVVVIHNGIDPDKFSSCAEPADIKARLHIPPDAKVMGIVARLHAVKDHRTFFDTVKIVRETIPEVHAVMAGDGELRAELEQYVREIGLVDCVTFLGTVRDDLADVLRIMDVFLLTSRVESLPNVLLEAMSASVPVVATRTHGVPEIVEDGLDGYLVSVGDSAEMADKVIEILMDEEVGKRFVENGLRKAQAFSIPSMVRKYEQLYREVLGVS